MYFFIAGGEAGRSPERMNLKV